MSEPDICGWRLPPGAYETNFDDLHPPLDRQRALVEASRCWFCHDAPCIEACPTGIDIPAFIRGIATDNVKGAAVEILRANIMGGTCARVCPTEILCEGACVRTAQEGQPVEIGALQRYATDWAFGQKIQPFARPAPTGRRIAVVGAGPAGLACAHALARQGHDIVVFERHTKPGGLNEFGIAAYKLAHGFAQAEVDFILSIGGIEIRYGMTLGQDLHLRELRRDFDAVFLGVGLSGTNALLLEGEQMAGVEDAVAFIARLRQAPDKATLAIGRDVVVIGGGNTAIDAAVQSRRLGAENVTIVYRRGPSAMSATELECRFAQTEGVRIRHWARPAALIGEAGRLRAVLFERTAAAPGGGITGTGDTFSLPADQVMKAIGQKLVVGPHDGTAEILATKAGKLLVDAAGATSLDRVWAGGDCTGSGSDLTVVAVEDGKRAAAAIHKALAR